MSVGVGVMGKCVGGGLSDFRFTLHVSRFTIFLEGYPELEGRFGTFQAGEAVEGFLAGGK